MSAEVKPVAWARKWYMDGETPKKERRADGRLVWPKRFKFMPVSAGQILSDDVPLVPMVKKENGDVDA